MHTIGHNSSDVADGGPNGMPDVSRQGCAVDRAVAGRTARKPHPVRLHGIQPPRVNTGGYMSEDPYALGICAGVLGIVVPIVARNKELHGSPEAKRLFFKGVLDSDRCALWMVGDVLQHLIAKNGDKLCGISAGCLNRYIKPDIDAAIKTYNKYKRHSKRRNMIALLFGALLPRSA